MKLKAITPILVIFVLACGSPNTFAYEPLDGAVAITSRGTIPLTPGPLLDDFTDGIGINTWGDLTGTFSSDDPPISCNASYESDTGIVFGGTGYSLKLDYNVSQSASYAGYYSKLGGANLASYTSLSFWIRGGLGGEFFKVELKNNSTTKCYDAHEDTNYYRNSAAVYITDYMDGGVTTEWKKVTIPFHNFANLDEWASMKELVIVFENSQSEANGSPKDGIVYIDDISFGSTSVDVVRIDHFGDKLGICALGGNIGDFDESPPAKVYSFSNTNYAGSPCGSYSLLSEYDVTYKWAGISIIFGGGNADNNLDMTGVKPEKMGWIKIPHDFSEYTYLSLWMKARSENENPKALKIELKHDSGTGRFYTDTLHSITGSWQQWRIPLADFAGLEKATIKEMTFVYEDRKVYYAVGAIYIDNVQFEK